MEVSTFRGHHLYSREPATVYEPLMASYAMGTGL